MYAPSKWNIAKKNFGSIDMTIFEAFVTVRNEALFSLDRKRIEAYRIKSCSRLTKERDRRFRFWLLRFMDRAAVRYLGSCGTRSILIAEH